MRLVCYLKGNLLKYFTMNMFCTEVEKSVHYLPPLSHMLRLFNTEGSGSGKEVPRGVPVLLGCGDVSLDDWCPTFRNTVQASSSRIKCPKKTSSFDIRPFKIWPPTHLERSGTSQWGGATSNKMKTSTVPLRKPKASQISRDLGAGVGNLPYKPLVTNANLTFIWMDTLLTL